MQDFRAAKMEKKESVQMRIVFKKRMFRDTDENITEPMFINLSYLQAKHDYLGGNYPVGKEDAVQLAAFQIQAEEGAALGQGAGEALAAGAYTRPFSAQPEPFLTHHTPYTPPSTPRHLLPPP